MNKNVTTFEVLKQNFGFDEFRTGQDIVVNNILSNRDVLGIMPTSAGKSICYQVPALMFDGITIVISPLISLMMDQVKTLNANGIAAAYINSQLSENEIREIIYYAENGAYKIIYIAPERLESSGFMYFAMNAHISMVTVDEAHCISQWGQDFRPSYMKIVSFIEKLPVRPVISAFTATATEEVMNDIVCILGLRKPQIVLTGFDRPNLHYSVEKGVDKTAYVANYINTHKGESGIIYCSTRKAVDELFETLYSRGYSVEKYHAGLNNDYRKRAQEDFIYDKKDVIIATNAFGMGIDKSNVRFVIHHNMPQCIENYYQEAGRAGRDGEPSNCILLYAPSDVMTCKFLLDHKDFSEVEPENVELLKERDRKRLRIMENYCKTTKCLRCYILDYFGHQKINNSLEIDADICDLSDENDLLTKQHCDNCGNCEEEVELIDMTEEAKQIINCIYEAKGRYGVNVITGTLVGANRAKLREFGTVNYRTYGKLSNIKENVLKDLIQQMSFEGYVFQTLDKYSVLKLGDDYKKLSDPDVKVYLYSHKSKQSIISEGSTGRNAFDYLTSKGMDLFDELRKLRLELARRDAVPPYIVFSDKTLQDMCLKLPQSEEEMLEVNGVGRVKLQNYGYDFLNRIKEYIEKNSNALISEARYVEEVNAVTETSSKKKKKKKEKKAFYITSEQSAEYEYCENCYVSDIKERLNLVAEGNDVYKITVKRIMELLAEWGYVEELNIEGRLIKMPTEKGQSEGITMEERVSTAGNSYNVLSYPESIQRLIVESFIDDNAAELEKPAEELIKDETINYGNSKKRAKKRTYSEWEEMYPDTVIIKKEGYFWTCRGDSALTVGALLGYNIGGSEEKPVTGSPKLDEIVNGLTKHKVNYIVVCNDKIIEGKVFNQEQEEVL